MTKANEKILIVEDDADLREAMTVILEGEGYEVVQAANGEEALQQLRTSRMFCLILLDLFMPVMDGFRFRSEQLQDQGLASIPVIVISADSAAPVAASKFGAVGAMVKPVDFDQLLRQIDQHC